jgi:hypothetical protein
MSFVKEKAKLICILKGFRWISAENRVRAKGRKVQFFNTDEPDEP